MMIAGGLALTLAGLSIGQPLEQTGPCPTLTRSNTYHGADPVLGPSSSWPIKPPTTITNGGKIQLPLAPSEAINCVIVPPGLKVQGIASELTPGPLGAAPMAYVMNFTFDERGRVWAIEPRDYPYTHDTLGNVTGTGLSTSAGLPNDRLTGKGRVLILEDTNGDGALDNFKVFYEGLALPTSIEVVKNGVIVTVPPNVYYIPKSNTNPDTAGATPSIIVSNMGSTGQNYDSHGQTNSLTRGIDNWIYVHNGYNGCATPAVAGGNSVTCPGTGSIQRFKSTTIGSDTNRIELYGPSNSQNAHGIGFMEDGQWFKSHATVTVHTYHVVRPNVLRDTGSNVWVGSTSVDIRNVSGGSGNTGIDRLYAVTMDRYLWEGNNATTNNITAGSITYTSTQESAVSGHDFYTARLLPQKYWSRFAFTCEGLSKLCNQDSLVRNGSTWSAHRLYPPNRWPNIFASTDAWSAPLKVRTGPEGALWVLDWYNYLFLHNPASPATNAAVRSPLRSKERVRIYRLLPADGSTQPVLNLTNATTGQLVSALFNTNLVWRMQAQRLLIERGYNAELGNLLDSILTRRRQVDAVGLDAPVIHALWTLHGLKQFEQNPTRWDPILKQLLLHPAWTVRRNVVQAMPATAATYAAFRDQCIVDDSDAGVRLAALSQLARIPASGATITSLDGLRSDSYITAAYTGAGTGKVVSGGAGTERPGTCPAYLAEAAYTPIMKGGTPFRFSPDVRFNIRQGGFAMASNPALASGELMVHDIRGKLVFRSVWNRQTGSWSNNEAKGLAHPVYFYTFRSYAGEKFNGRIPLSSI
jgi:putative membrane-bound dehydrogenase-like protein